MKPLDWSWTFEVPGPLIGHKCSVRAAMDKNFRGFKRTVRLLANVANVPSELNEDGVYEVHVVIFFKGRARVDPENIRKSLIDGLWERDRRVLHGSYRTFENTPMERAEVRITRIE